ncbi:MAG: vapB2 [Pseudonocardiales bacterium]|nr:vapB2 [Pseudonocardiales bacterium]
MSEILIRDVSDEVLAGLDANATRLGLSRVEYIRRRLAQDATSAMTVTMTDLRSFADAFADLADPAVIDDAWK